MEQLSWRDFRETGRVVQAEKRAVGLRGQLVVFCRTVCGEAAVSGGAKVRLESQALMMNDHLPSICRGSHW